MKVIWKEILAVDSASGHALPGPAEWTVHSKFGELDAAFKPAWTASLLDEMAFGVAIVNASRCVLHVSRGAFGQMQLDLGLRISDDCIEAELASETNALQAAIDGALEGRRSYIAFSGTRGRLEVAFVPIESRSATSSGAAALIFEKLGRSAGLGLYFYGRTYGLTRAEQSVLAELGDGASVCDAARQLGSSVHTARTHVRRILAKTGQSNLRGLIRRLGMLPPIAARLGIQCPQGESSEACPGWRMKMVQTRVAGGVAGVLPTVP